MTTPADQWMVAAVHESAHACAYAQYGKPFISLRIYQTDSGAIVGSVKAPAGRYDPLMKAVVNLAGPLAKQRYTGCSWQALTDTVAKTDIGMALGALARLGAEQPGLDKVVALTCRLSIANGRTSNGLPTNWWSAASSIMTRCCS